MQNRTTHPSHIALEEIRAIQLDLLDHLLAVCRDNHLQIWADSGTLLGAIRHKGFIPWDDDIDMVMMRKDYDILVEISAQHFLPPYFFQTAYSEREPYPRGHAQLRLDGTAAILLQDINQNFHQGIFIDIFPLDVVPDDLAKKESLFHSADALFHMMLDYSYGHPSLIHYSDNRRLRALKKKIDGIGFKSLFSSYEDLFRAIPMSEADTISTLSFRLDSPAFSKEFYAETLMAPFENRTIPIPKGYDQILSIQYGDYMIPVQAPSLHGGFVVLDPTKSYEEYLPALRKQRKKMIWEERIEKLFKKLH